MPRKNVKLLNRGLKLLCPCCGDKEAEISLNLSTMTLTCESCSDSFSPETARKIVAEALARWETMCRWIGQAHDTMGPVQRDCDVADTLEFHDDDDEPAENLTIVAC
jgi:uncharacterized protein (DUF983 family)